MEEHKEHYQTYRRYLISSKALLKYANLKKPIDEITPSHIEDYKIWRARQKRKNTKRLLRPATINRELACLKAMFNHALKGRHDFRNPVTEVEFLPENNEQTRVLTFEEQGKYLRFGSDPLKDVATLILETGCARKRFSGSRHPMSQLTRAISTYLSARQRLHTEGFH